MPTVINPSTLKPRFHEPEIKVSKLTTLMQESGVRATTIEVVVKLYQSKSLKDVAIDLKVSQGRVKHRLLEACRILENTGKAELASLLLVSIQ